MSPRQFLSAAVAILAAAAAVADQPSMAPPASHPASTPAVAQQAPKSISQEALLERQARHDASLFVLDVRTPAEFAAGHVPDAVNIPYDQIASRLQDVPKDKDVVLYCKSGRRAGLAAEVLEAHGYTRLEHLQGDMEAWTKDGRPVQGAVETGPTG